jgi:hypothetical protein
LLACQGFLGATGAEAVVRGSNTHHYIIKFFIKETARDHGNRLRCVTSNPVGHTGTVGDTPRRVSVTISTFISSLLKTGTFRRRLRGRGFRCRRFGRGRFRCGRLSIGTLWLSYARVLAIPQRVMAVEGQTGGGELVGVVSAGGTGALFWVPGLTRL